MPDPSVEAIAALNNAEWCAAVWRSHGLPVGQAHGLWFCECETPRYYPNVVTVDPNFDAARQSAFIDDLGRTHPGLDMSVKDSFTKLDLRDAGMTPLFVGRWMLRASRTDPARPLARNWCRITDEQNLTAWETAWSGGDASSQRIFTVGLLSDPRVWVMGGFDPDGAIRAGAIANEAAGVLGLTNMFGASGEFLQAVSKLWPGISTVCYARGDGHRSAAKAGFQVLGPMRVWVREEAAQGMPGRTLKAKLMPTQDR